MNKPTQEDLERGYQECVCGEGIRLLQAGTECATAMCERCLEYVTDRAEFLNANEGVRALSK